MERNNAARTIALALLIGLIFTLPASGAVREMPLPAPEALGPAEPALDLTLPTSPPPDPQIGDSWLWWYFIHVGMPHFEQRMATVRGRTDHAYVVVEDTQWNVNFFQSDVDQILERWENSSIGPWPDQGIYEINSTHLGDPPDALDNDPRIYINYFEFGNTSDGFFFWFDQYPDGMYYPYQSNECETVYLNTMNGQNPSGEYMVSVIAHEFEHMIHWNYDENEESWVDEGMAELAMWLYGRPDVISGFNTNPDNPLTVWEGNWADYIKTYLWSLYYYERFGGGDVARQLIAEPMNSIFGYEAVLTALGYEGGMATLFADWAVANYIDDPSIGDGRYGYVGTDLPPFNTMGTYTSYPVPDQNRTVGHWATDYYRFNTFGELSAIRFGFNGADNTEFAVWCLALRGDGSTDVLPMTLDPDTQDGTLDVVGLTHPDDEVVLVVAGVSTYGGTGYFFNADGSPASVDDARPGSVIALSSAPNPSHGTVTLTCAHPLDESIALEVLDLNGRHVRTLHLAAGAQGVTWDGRDDGDREVPAGIYYAQAVIAGERVKRAIVRLP